MSDWGNINNKFGTVFDFGSDLVTSSQSPLQFSTDLWSRLIGKDQDSQLQAANDYSANINAIQQAAYMRQTMTQAQIALANKQKEKEKFMITTRLKQFDVDRADLDEMVEVSCLGKLLVAEYEANSLKAPEWVNDTLDSLKTEIAARKRDNLAKRLKDAKARQTQLRSQEEKKADLANEIAELEAALKAAKE
jgi:hypothetical protein